MNQTGDGLPASPLAARRGGGLIAGGVVLLLTGVLGLIIGHTAIDRASRASTWDTRSGLPGLIEKTRHINTMTNIEAALDIIMAVVILASLAFLIVGIVRRTRSGQKL